jgi:hypothetical protein
MRVCGPDNVRANIRLRLPGKPSGIEGKLTPQTVSDDADKSGTVKSVAVTCEWDEETRTALLSYDSAAGEIDITGGF